VEAEHKEQEAVEAEHKEQEAVEESLEQVWETCNILMGCTPCIQVRVTGDLVKGDQVEGPG
jgi:hypothetical protein